MGCSDFISQLAGEAYQMGFTYQLECLEIVLDQWVYLYNVHTTMLNYKMHWRYMNWKPGIQVPAGPMNIVIGTNSIKYKMLHVFLM